MRGERRHYPSTYADMIPAPDGPDLYPQLCMKQGAWLRAALTYGELKRSAARRIWRGRDLSGGAGRRDILEDIESGGQYTYTLFLLGTFSLPNTCTARR